MLMPAASMARFNQNLIVLGDFNIDRKDDPLYQAFVSTGLHPPTELEGLPRTIFDDPGKEHFFDQIAWFTGEDGGSGLEPPLAYDRLGGSFDFPMVLLKDMTTTELSWRISDHFPLWAGFSVRMPSA
jgi:endonuclease/exonuclease/phosphatase family metal-dependent hydrolase